MEKIKINGHTAFVTMSGRGYVVVRSRNKQPVVEEMKEDLRHKICEMPYKDHVKPWQEEMTRLKKIAITRARREWKG